MNFTLATPARVHGPVKNIAVARQQGQIAVEQGRIVIQFELGPESTQAIPCPVTNNVRILLSNYRLQNEYVLTRESIQFAINEFHLIQQIMKNPKMRWLLWLSGDNTPSVVVVKSIAFSFIQQTSLNKRRKTNFIFNDNLGMYLQAYMYVE